MIRSPLECLYGGGLLLERLSNACPPASPLSIHQVLEGIGRAVVPATSALTLLAVFMLTFAALGMQVGWD